MTISPTYYFNSGTTSWPKPSAVTDAVLAGLSEPESAGRGSAPSAERKILAARGSIARALGVEDSSRLVFQPSATYALNMVIQGLVLDLLKSQDRVRVLVSNSEHNSVTRPLFALVRRGTALDIEWIPLTEDAQIDIEFVENRLREAREGEEPQVDIIACQHGSNVTGAIHPIAELCRLARQNNIATVIDGAQAGGHFDVNLANLNPSAWVCSGHKGFRGPAGIGIVYLAPDCNPTPLVFGGTGAGGYDEVDSDAGCPEIYEAGTEPLPGILGLAAGVKYVTENKQEIYHTEHELIELLVDGLCRIEGVHVLGPKPGAERIPLVSITVDGISPHDLAFSLERGYGIIVRAGFQCAPRLHEYLGTSEIGGALRLSVSNNNTAAEVATVLDAIQQILTCAR